MVNRLLATCGFAFALGLTACGPSSQSGKSTSSDYSQEIIAAASGEWLSHGRTYSEERFSPLTSVQTNNVDSLGLAWSFDLGTSKGIEATPIVSDGIIYVTGTWNIVHALDAKTGESLWAFDPDVDRSRAAYLCCGVVNRGVAKWGDKIYTATIDGRLIAINALTGKKIWDINTIDESRPYTITGAPRIINGKVIIGNGGAELGVRGYVSAYDTETGDMDWRFYTVPGNPADGFEDDTMKMAAETWNGEWWEAGGGGTVWDSMAYDPDLNLLYIGVGNGSPWNHEIRSDGEGDNLFLSSIVALNPDNGEYVWHYQTTPAETWDYTATQHMILAEMDFEGQQRKVIMQAPKNGFFYVIDRETGEFLSGNNFVPVSWATGLDPVTGRPDTVPEAYYGKTGKPFLGMPSPAGGHSWQPMSYNHETGLVYFSAMEMPFGYTGVKAEDFKYKEKGWNTGEDASKASMPEDPAIRTQIRSMMKGKLLAWDPIKQEEAWSVPMGVPWNGGTLTTSGNLVFHGNGEGYFNAYSADTGEKVWEQYVSSGIVASPVTYAVDGKQYISIAVGWGGILPLNLGEPLKKAAPPTVNRVVTFEIGGEVDLPVEEGFAFRVKYHESCWMCHGDTGVNNGGVTNLRYSRAIADEELFSSFVLGGIAEYTGMPNFSEELDKAEVEAIRAYIIKRANDLKDNPDMP